MNTLGRATLWLVSSALLSVGVAGCGGCGGVEHTNSEQLVSDLSRSYCEWGLTCCTDAEFLAELEMSYTAESAQLLALARQEPDECEELVKSVLGRFGGRLAAAEKAGRIRLPEKNADACLESIDSRIDSCDAGSFSPTSRKQPSPCSEAALAVGQGEDGAECFAAWECTEGLICRKSGSRFGRCAVPQGNGESCSSSAPCSDDLHCSGLNVSFCSDASEATDTYCDNDRDCSETLFCSGVLRQCLNKQADGRPCASSSACLSGRCDVRTETCAENLAGGTACRDNSECGMGAYCDATKPDKSICIAQLEAGAGDRCGGSDVHCAADLVCENDVCVAQSGTDGWCDQSGAADDYCPAAQYCVDNTCVNKVAVGDRCDSDERCVDTAHCDGDVSPRRCAERIAVSVDCQPATANCVAGAYCDAVTDVANPVCAVLAALDADCSEIGCAQNLRCRATIGECTGGLAVDAECDGGRGCTMDAYCGDDPGAPDDVCLGALTIADGESCNRSSRICGQGSFCEGFASLGTCKPLLATDDQCISSAAEPGCAAGSFCRGVSPFTCQVRLATDDQCIPNATDPGCAAGSFCEGFASSGTCKPLLALADICLPGSLTSGCGNEAYCSFGATSTCTARVAAGAACGGDDLVCPDGYLCSGTQECVEAPAAGENCNLGTRPASQCRSGLICASGTCVALVNAGDVCAAQAACPAAHHCAKREICLPSGTVGESCGRGGECAAGLQCLNSGVCRSRPGVDETCEPPPFRSGREPCVEGARCEPEAAYCVQLVTGQDVGEQCVSDAECDTNRCISGLCVAVCVGL